MRMVNLACVGWGLATLLAVTGCGGRSVSQVSGLVKLDDTPIVSGAILFVPVDGSTPTTGGEIKDGRYSVEVPHGRMKVSISAPRVVGTRKLYDTDDSDVVDVTQEAVPARYNEQTELQFEVTGGSMQKDFDLVGQSPGS